ncbi:MAG: patatin-like phospholipase family protein [Spirosomaceae bacterium]|jgi:patatin-like phospholipase/acyl hydrolase|nr:patatin-like phospholipase family protein [Spirosomataceae bacterium]
MNQVNKEFKILSIDGGGIRGIIPSKFLSNLEAHVSKEKGEEVKLNEYFDLICGTSTGGIIAIGLGLGMKANEIHELYEKNATKIFGSPIKKWYLTGKQIFRAKHKRDNLSNLLKEIFSKYSDDSDTRLGHSKTRLCIPTFNAGEDKTVVLKTSHHTGLFKDYQIPAYQVALATSAAPIYFKPFTINYKTKNDSNTEVTIPNMLDGGVFANNPTLIGLSEALALGYKFEDIKILSIGTGLCKLTRNTKKVPNEGIFSWLSLTKKLPLIQKMMRSQSEIIENVMKFIVDGIHNDKDERIFYQRLQTYFIDEDIELDDTSPSKIKILNDKGNNMFHDSDKRLLETFFKNKVEQYKPYHQV